MANITKRINKDKSISYRIRVSNGFKANGRPNVISKTWKPPKNFTQKEINKELNRLAIKLEEDTKNGIKYDNNILFETYSKEWLENRKNNVEQKTFSEYERLVKRINERFGNIKIINIKSSDISKYFNDLRQPGANKNNGSYLSENTIKHIYRVIKDLLDCACDVNIINKNPLREKAFVAPKLVAKEKKILQEDDIKKLLSLLNNENIKWRTIITLLLNTGMRIGELVALEWNDIDFINCEININKSITYISSIGKIEKQPKTKNSKRTISISQETVKILSKYKEWQIQEKLKLQNLWPKKITLLNNKRQPFNKLNDKLFTENEGQPMSPDTISKWVHKFAIRNNMDFTAHSLRHTFVSLLVRKNLPINLISKSVGHSNSNTTLNVYSHLFKDDNKQISNALSEELERITNEKQD